MRFIPARAGNTRCVRVRALRRRAHPHSRREYLGSSGLGFGWSGSLPLVRGTCPPAYFWFCVRRLIPATAENTKRHRTHASSLRLIPARTGSIRVTRQTEAPTPAHPRSRGDYTRFEITRWSCKGSSPLARGTTSKGRRFAGLPEAHPHSRGEHDPAYPNPSPS